MNAKLTLTIEKDLIEKAKQYAKKENRSLSNLIESFLKQVTHKKVEEEYDIPPEIAALRGSVKVPKDFSFDYKKELRKAKYEKFSKYLDD